MPKLKRAKSKAPKTKKKIAKKTAKKVARPVKAAKAAVKAPRRAAPAKRKAAARTPSGRATIVPALRYRDAVAAIDFLCDAFGFTRHMVVPGDDGTIEHAQLVLGNGMIMLGSVRDNQFGRLITQPDEIENMVTQSPYVVVEGIDEHYARARDAGAEIIMELTSQDYGGKLYAARDSEGHIWNFGSYDPWEEAE